MEKIYVDGMVLSLSVRTCRICGAKYKWDTQCGSDLRCCSEACESDWLSYIEDMEKEPIQLVEWEE